MPRTIPVALIAAVALAATLAACGDDAATDETTAAAPVEEPTTEAADEPAAEPTPATSEPSGPTSEPSGPPSEDPAAGGASAGTLQELPYDEGLVDDVLGHEIRFTGLVRDFPAPLSDFEGGEFLLVEVEATAGEEFSGGIYGGFGLTAPDGTVHSRTGVADEDMAAAGYPPFEDLSSGESGTGWIAFQANTRSDTYTLDYERSAASVIGSDETIEQQIWEFPVP